jgi:hypothetical protein
MNRNMDGSALPRDASLVRRHTHGDGFGYGWLLVLILVSITFQLAAPETDVAQVITIGLQGLTLIAALHVSGVRTWLIHLAAGIAAIALLAAIGVLIGSGELDDGAGRLLGFLFVVLAPTAIVVGIVRQARRDHAITLRTMAGVLCVYLLIGSAFAFAYGIVSVVESGSFFAQQPDGDISDFLYFSFVTLTTTGYGDLTAAQDFGRSLAITEALIGQIYLVTVVALIVGNIGSTRLSRS